MGDADLAMQAPRLGVSALSRFHKAAQDWIDSGAKWVDLPWTAPEAHVESTRPLSAGAQLQTPHGHLLASGEQAFLWLAERDMLPSGLLIGWSPCFRDEPVFDRWHQFGFMKIEAYKLLHEKDHPISELSKLVEHAATHFENWAGRHVYQKFFRDGTADIDLNGHEIGSYGIRKHPFLAGKSYLYGTVLAEPRFSTALEEGLA